MSHPLSQWKVGRVLKRALSTVTDGHSVSRIEMNMTTLVIQRSKEWADKLRKYRILLNNEEIGHIGEGEEIRHQVADGPHIVAAKIDWCGSRPRQVVGQSDDIVVLVHNPRRGWQVLSTIFYIIFKTREYLILEQKQPGGSFLRALR